MVDAIGILKVLSQSEHEVETGKTLSHEDATSTARKAIEPQ
jgi:hypothetical protein